MMRFIPEKYQLLAQVVAGAVALALAALAGAVVNGWRLEAGHQTALSQQQEKYHKLDKKLTEQNAAVEAMGGRAAQADQRRATAEKIAAGALRDLGNRSAAVAASKATDCDGVLREQWK